MTAAVRVNILFICLLFWKSIALGDTLRLVVVTSAMHRQYRQRVVETISNNAQQWRCNDRPQVDVRRKFSQCIDHLLLVLHISRNDAAVDVTLGRKGLSARPGLFPVFGIDALDQKPAKESAERRVSLP